jgi:hypothetical protein
MRGGCGSEVVLETVNAHAPSSDHRFRFPPGANWNGAAHRQAVFLRLSSVAVPVLYSADYWISAKEKAQGDFIDAFLGDPGLCRFYLGMSKLDPETADALKKGVTLRSGCAPLRACWISSAAISRSARAKQSFRAARDRLPPGENWPAPRPTREPSFSKS